MHIMKFVTVTITEHDGSSVTTQGIEASREVTFFDGKKGFMSKSVEEVLAESDIAFYAEHIAKIEFELS